MEVEIRIKGCGIELIDGGGVFLRDVAVSHEFADDGAILALGQGVVVGLPGP